MTIKKSGTQSGCQEIAGKNMILKVIRDTSEQKHGGKRDQQQWAVIKLLQIPLLKANTLWEPDICLEYLANIQLYMYSRYNH